MIIPNPVSVPYSTNKKFFNELKENDVTTFDDAKPILIKILKNRFISKMPSTNELNKIVDDFISYCQGEPRMNDFFIEFFGDGEKEYIEDDYYNLLTFFNVYLYLNEKTDNIMNVIDYILAGETDNTNIKYPKWLNSNLINGINPYFNK